MRTRTYTHTHTHAHLHITCTHTYTHSNTHMHTYNITHTHIHMTYPSLAYGYGFLLSIAVSGTSLFALLLVPCLKPGAKLFFLYKPINALMMGSASSALLADAVLHILPEVMGVCCQLCVGMFVCVCVGVGMWVDVGCGCVLSALHMCVCDNCIFSDTFV